MMFTAASLGNQPALEDLAEQVLIPFFDRFPPLRLPTFYLSVKTHKTRAVVDGSWPPNKMDTKGITWHKRFTDNFVSNHLVVSADKDSNQIITSPHPPSP